MCSDPIVADLLARKSRGEKLQPAEYGKLGQWTAKQNRAAGPAISKTALPSAPGTAPKTFPTGEQVASLDVQSEIEGAGVPLSPGDSRFVSTTVNALCTKCNAIGQRKLAKALRTVSDAATKANVPLPSLDKFSTAEVFTSDDRAILVETAPQVCEAFGVNPKNVPVGAFFGTLTLAGMNFYQAVGELNEISEKILEAVKKLETAPPAPPKPGDAAK